MTLRLAHPDEKRVIYHWWKEIFAFDDGGHIDYYFDKYVPNTQLYVLADDQDQLLSALNVHTKTMQFNGDWFQTSFIVGIFTPPKHRHQGHMHQLLTEVLNHLSATDLFTLIQAYEPGVYAPFGFVDLYARRQFILDAKHVPVLSSQGVTYEADAEAMTDVYRRFTKHFNGYAKRTVDDMRDLIGEVKAQQGKIISVNGTSGLSAYAFIFPHTTHIDIDEIVYTDAKALLQIVSTLLASVPKVLLKVSQAEDLTKLFPKAPMERVPYTALRINNLELFNAHFNVSAPNATSAMVALKRPLWFRENQ